MTLGFVVLARRPDGSCEPVKMRGHDTGVVFNGPNALEQAQNAREYCEKKQVGNFLRCQYGCTGDDEATHNGWFRCTPESRALLAKERAALDPVEYVIGQIEQWEGR